MLVSQLFGDDNDDFKSDFGLSPVLAATLNEYDTYDCERPSLQEILQHASLLATSGRSDYNALKNEYIDRSPLYFEVIRHYEAGANIKRPGGSLFQDLIEQPDEIQGWTPLLWAAYTGRVKEVGILLDHGADPLKITQAGRNIFHHAAEAANIEVLEYLLRQGCNEKGVDISLRDYWGETPLHIATVRSADLVKVLLEHGAEIGQCQGSGELPLHYLRHLQGEVRLKTMGNLLTALEPNSPLINSVNDIGYPCLFYLLDTPECVKILLDWGADITLVDQQGRNVLHHACMKNHEESLCLLLEHCSVDMVTAIYAEGNTPLFIACQNHAIDCVLTLLRRYHHPPQTVDNEGGTLLHHVAGLDHESILDHVLSIPGIDKKARTKKGQTAYDIAQEHRCRWSIREKLGRL
jgi:ankyrin repeat protein